MTQVYTRDGSAPFNEWLHEALTRIADQVEQALGDNLVALVLGGGYGRGEGAVILAADREMPYNDLDFTLIVNRKALVSWDSLGSISRSFGAELNVHVDFSRPLTVQDIRRWPCWLMWHDLLNGHVVLKGPPDILARNAPPALKGPLPVIEGTRLLLNRGAGLLWALRIVRGVEKSPDEDFVRRNYYKCALALGDSLLIAYQRFTTMYLGRDALFAALERDKPTVESFRLLDLYGKALRFKFRPDHIPSHALGGEELNALAAVWGSVFLHVETVRTGIAWASLDEYVRWDGIRERDQHTTRRLIRNVGRNLQVGKWDWRYPREDLYRHLPVLLALTGKETTNWADETERFLKVWDRFN